MEHCRILTVGCGLAGFAPQLIERKAAWEVAGTGMYSPADGVRALRALGPDQAMAARAAEIPDQRLLDHRDRLAAHPAMIAVAADTSQRQRPPERQSTARPRRG